MSTSSIERTTGVEIPPAVEQFLATSLHKAFVGGRWVEAAGKSDF